MVFQTETSAEVILHLIAAEAGVSLEEAICRAARRLVGSYAIGIVGQGRLIGIRDPLGIRPLAVGRSGDAWFVASSLRVDAAGAELVRDVAPGRDGGHRRRGPALVAVRGRRPGSHVRFRVHLLCPPGQRHRREDRPRGAEGDRPAPGAEGGHRGGRGHRRARLGLFCALGFAETAGIPFDVGLATNRYVGRTFIQPTPAMRRRGVHIKHNPIVETLRGKRVILVDDSIVRGTTSRRMIRLLKEAGAKRSTWWWRRRLFPSLPLRHRRAQLGPADRCRRSVNEVCRLIGADSLHYLDFESLYQAVGVDGRRLCAVCFGAPYPTPVGTAAPPRAATSWRRGGCKAWARR